MADVLTVTPTAAHDWTPNVAPAAISEAEVCLTGLAFLTWSIMSLNSRKWKRDKQRRRPGRLGCCRDTVNRFCKQTTSQKAKREKG